MSKKVVRWSSIVGATALLMVFAMPSHAHRHWFSKRIDPGEPAWAGMLSETGLSATGPKLFDIVISLHDDRDGDDDGNMQGGAGNAEQDTVERIIQHFADAVHEATEGAHALRKVRIYQDGEYASQADVLWKASGHPSANPNGIASAGQHIFMFDVFAMSTGNHSFLTDEIGGGYTLAHEWGHYAYGLYDEYMGSVATHAWDGWPLSGDTPVSPSIMNSQWNATGGNTDWLNFSIAADADPGTAYENTLNTAQHRMFGASGWEVLARSTFWDRRWLYLVAGPSRTYYPELTPVAPADEPTSPDAGNGRTHLDIIWVGEGLVSEVVLDKSGSMCSENKISNARTAAKHLVDLAEEGKSTIGVIAFDDSASVVAALTEIENAADKATLKSLIDGINCSGGTAVGAASQLALTQLMAAGDDTARVVFLLTDGVSGDDPLVALSGYQNESIPILAFAYGSDADLGVMRALGNGTGGAVFISPTSLADVTRAFQDANVAASAAVSVESLALAASPGIPTSTTFVTDSTMSRFDLTVVSDGNESDSTIELLAPGGSSVPAVSIQESGGQTSRLFTVAMPPAGIWRLNVNDVAGQQTVTGEISSAPAGITYAATLTSVGGNVVTYPEPIVVYATLERLLPIAGADVTATLTAPDGTVTPVQLLDDGVPPDLFAGDGNYSAVLDYSADGVHEVVAHFNNQSGTTEETSIGLALSVRPDGSDFGVPPNVAVVEPFQRLARLQLAVEGFAADDHGDDPSGATGVSADTDDLPGRIDFDSDVDSFEILATPGEELSCRVTDQALGMSAAATLLGADGLELLAEAEVVGDEHLLLTTMVGDGGLVYLQVRHREATGRGTYRVSCGSRLHGDPTGVYGGCTPGDVHPLDGGDGRIGLADFLIAWLGVSSPWLIDEEQLACADVSPGYLSCTDRTETALATWCAEGDDRVDLLDLLVLGKLVFGGYEPGCEGCDPHPVSLGEMRRPGDIAPGAGDAELSVADVIRALRFSVHLDAPTDEERLRADVAPASEGGSARVVLGDGLVDVSDVLVLLGAAVDHWSLQWPERSLAVHVNETATTEAVSVSVGGWPVSVEGVRAELPDCPFGRTWEADLEASSWGVACITGLELRSGLLATFTYRAPEAVDLGALSVRGEFLDGELEPIEVAPVLRD